MAKRIVIDVDEDEPKLTEGQWKKLIADLEFVVDAHLEIKEYTVREEGHNCE